MSERSFPAEMEKVGKVEKTRKEVFEGESPIEEVFNSDLRDFLM